jgi:transcriptional regulator with PAS, ATPase and Fis domain
MANTRSTHTLKPEARALLDGITEPAVLLSPDYRIVAANGAYCSRYNNGEALLHRHCYEVSHHFTVPCDQAGETCPLKNCLDSGESQRVLHLHHTPDGDEHVDVSMMPIRDSEGHIIYFLEKLRQTRSASSQPAAQGLVGRSRPFNQMLELMHRVAASNTAVLLLGESGTGKELVARAIHQSSPRSSGPFIPVECAGLSETLFESELFGHEKGAFTGAHTRKIGLVEAANSGTLFLDEIGDIPLSQQIKLLRLLETGMFRRVGGTESINADFRLILATHRDLQQQVKSGAFRQDLYYRISMFPIDIPPLRERLSDLGLLITSLLGRIAHNRDMTVDSKAMNCLLNYAFPGNIRELRNILERAVLLADDNTIMPNHLPDACRQQAPHAAEGDTTELVTLAENERRYLIRALAACPNDRQALASKLGISKRTLFRKLDEIKNA